ncbi:hypothetical protein F2Q70_00016743 [Brassica cretica]|uniref:Uncharacterized protein n=1 Tax=Brassica cretica TaxID=69181 RepID=A0A3N6QFX6_BRACR|nr:hypothetical protein F2Q70_00016743 [Brassica cretica]KAF2599141.1 hypothetical protein F2Q68_00009722 [Brassica cretica]
MDMEDKGQSFAMAESSRTKANIKELKRSKSGTRLSAPLGIQTKKTECSFGHSDKENRVPSSGLSTYEIN